ncbi:MAG: two-component system OmpR family response regulator [Gammaproteobacteria bacterium]
MFAEQPFDLIVLDVMLPEIEGTDVCRAIRRDSNVPIVFLSARDDEIDRIIGLEIGGDDYLSKPFSPREIVARIRAVLRRIESAREPNSSAPATAQHGRLSIDLDQCKAKWANEEIVLTATELGILRSLLSRPGKVCSREQLMDGAYSYHNVVSDRTIDSHVRRVRAKFARFNVDPIATVHGLGYRLGTC